MKNKENDIRKKLGLVDSRSQQGILARGKTRYPEGSPNPTGINSSNAVKLLNARRKRMKGK